MKPFRRLTQRFLHITAAFFISLLGLCVLWVVWNAVLVSAFGFINPIDFVDLMVLVMLPYGIIGIKRLVKSIVADSR